MILVLVMWEDLRLGQRRFWVEFDLEPVAYHEFPGDSAGGKLCFSRPSGVTSTARLEPTTVEWRLRN